MVGQQVEENPYAAPEEIPSVPREPRPPRGGLSVKQRLTKLERSVTRWKIAACVFAWFVVMEIVFVH